MSVTFYVQHYNKSSKATDAEHFGKRVIRDALQCFSHIIPAFKSVATNQAHYLVLNGSSIFL